jgi:hypothetical protein
MSYDMSIGDRSFNYTYNVSGMWYDCYPDEGIRKHYGLSGFDALPVLRKLRDHMEENKERLVEMNPSNGWGDFDGAYKFVCDLILASVDRPSEIWEGD